ncbi:hypothetical protein VOLCADRAFT_117158, partial [Volvox carteri f. nagariensis]
CPVNGSTPSLLYTAGDVATGTIPNCGMRFWEPEKATSRPTVKLLHPNIVITNTTVIPLAKRMSDSMQYPLGVDVIDSVLWTKEPLREFSARPEGIREAWFLDPVLTADMADEPVSALLDMSQLVGQDRNLNWNGYGTFFRRFASVYDGKVVGLPVSAAIMLLYYRRDFFALNNITVPATWEEVVDIAERWNDTDLDGTGAGAWGFCMSRQPSTRRAAELYRRLSRFTAPTEQVACLPVSLAFVWGRCLMAVGTTLHFKYATFNNSLNNITRVRGKTGTAVLPGSFEVMNRTSGKMVRCNPDICPHGKLHKLANGTTAWVNVAPYAGRGAFTYAINRHREPHLQYMAYRLCARRVYADAMWPSVLSATAAGYDKEDTLLFMKAVSDTMEHPNIALNLRIYGALEYYFAVDKAAVALSDSNASIDAILATAQKEVVQQYGNVTVEWLKKRYWKSIDRALPAPPPPVAPHAGLSNRGKVGIGVGGGLGGGLLLLGLVALAVVVVWRPACIRQNMSYVPYPSPECTLVVTDMEGDSFIVAFPSALAALRFAQDFQAELLAADWPAVLLQDSDLCRPVYAAPRAAKELQGQLSRRSGSLRPPTAATRAPTPLPVNPSGSASFTHINSVAAALSATAAAAGSSLTAGRSRSGAQLMLQPSRILQPPGGAQLQQPQHQPSQQQLQEGQASYYGGYGGTGPSLGDIPEQYIPDTQNSCGSLGSLSGLGRLPSGLFRRPPALQAGLSGGGGSMAAAAAAAGPPQGPSRLLAAAPLPRASPLSAPPRMHPAAPALGSFAVDSPFGSPAAAAAAAAVVDTDAVTDPVTAAEGSPATAASLMQLGGAGGATAQYQQQQQPLVRAQHSLLSKPSGDDPGVSGQLAALMAADYELASSPVAGAAASVATPGAAAAAAASVGVSGGGVSVSGGGGGSTWLWGSEAAAAWQLVDGSSPGAVLLFRGLRIRVGLYSGVRPTELTFTRASSRISFCGLAIRMAKAVSDSAHGGMIVLSGTSASQLLGVPEVAVLLAGEGTELWHLGRVKLAEDLAAVELFQPIRIGSQVLPGVLLAPAGSVALVRLNVSGLSLLRASAPDLAAESLPALGGYLSEARQGGAEGITVAFPDGLRAVAWALAVQADMLHWDWSPELLQHEAFETIAIDGLGDSSSFTNLLLAGARGGTRPLERPSSGEIVEVPVSKPSRSRLYDSRSGIAPGVVPPAEGAVLSFSSQTGTAHGGGGGGGRGASFSSQTGRPEAAGGSRPSTLAAPLASPFLSIRQRYLLRGGGTLSAGGEGPAPSLLSPLQPPPELPAEAPAAVEKTRGSLAAEGGKLPPSRISLPGFMRRGRLAATSAAAAAEEEGGDGAAERETVATAGGEEGGRGSVAEGDVESGRREESDGAPVAAAAAAGEPRPSPAREVRRLAAKLFPTAVATAAATTRVTTETSAVQPFGEALTSPPESAAAAAAAPAAVAPAAGSDGADQAAEYGAPTVEDESTAAAAAVAAASVGSGRGLDAGGLPAPRFSAASSVCPPRAYTYMHRVLFRGPRTKAVVDFGSVSTEICRTTGRLLYRGRMAKQMTKLLGAAQRGQTAGSGRRKPAAVSSRTGPGAFARPPSAAALSVAGVSTVGGAVSAAATEPQEVAAVPKKAQYYLCTLAPPLPPARGDGKLPLPTGDASVRTIFKAADSPVIRSKPEL